jgi:dihydroflavonol-4-reductase
MLLGFLNGTTPAYLESLFNIVDVRQAAFGHILAAEHGRIGERYILGGVNVRLSELLAMLGEITGRPMPRRRVPYPLALAFAMAAEFVADHITHRPPVAPVGGVRLARTPMIFDSSKAQRERGFPETSLRKTLADAVAWLQARGLVRGHLVKPAGERVGSLP